jgi:lipopolysaccharide/colanic/teichoic acid biosynthesis glycosyltransferase
MANDFNSEVLPLSLREVEYDFGASRVRSAPAEARPGPSVLFRYQVLKRLMDLVLAGLSLPVWLPLILMLAAVVKLTSPGPVFFLHRRICRDGSFFSMWKFRTMCVDSCSVLDRYLAGNPEARSEWLRTHKLRFDPRVTPIGRVLRRYSLDELPQIWNVVRGEMSLVGPRPIVAAEIDKYGDSFDCYCRVKPGITGAWQVSGRSSLSYEERIRLDCSYVKHWSIFGDVKILLRTFRSVVNQDGAF